MLQLESKTSYKKNKKKIRKSPFLGFLYLIYIGPVYTVQFTTFSTIEISLYTTVRCLYCTYNDKGIKGPYNYLSILIQCKPRRPVCLHNRDKSSIRLHRGKPAARLHVCTIYRYTSCDIIIIIIMQYFFFFSITSTPQFL